MRAGRASLTTAAVAAVLSLGHAALPAAADEEMESTPLESSGPSELEAAFAPTEELEEPLISELPALIAGGKITVGLEFEMDRLGFGFGDNGFIPPDTMGAVGPEHIVQMINGRYQIYDKFTGLQLDNRSLDSFWTNVVGLPAFANGGRFDPRVVYDPDSERWFAVSIDRGINIGDTNPVSNNFFIGRTDTDDPTGDWDGFTFVADTVNQPQFHDYPTLAVDRVGLYTCTQDFGPGTGAESCYSIPKADLILPAPSMANLSRFEEAPAGLPPVRGSWQPALDFGSDDGRAALLGVEGGALVRTNIFGAAGAGAFLGVPTGIAGDPGHAGPPAARQPHPSDPTVTIENVAPRFVGNVFELDDSLWAVHAVLGSGSNSALRWYEIHEGTNTVLQTGLIDDPNRDFHEPSIAANEFGNVVIGYTCSGPTLSPSTCVSIGETDDLGVTTFEPPTILFTGLGHYYRDFCDEPNDDCGERNRWGDYSATVVDPVDSCTFWTFQEYVAQSAVGNVGPQGADGLTPRDGNGEGGLWGTRVAELTFNSCAGGDVRVRKDCKPDDPLLVGGTAICTIDVDNLGPGTALEVVLVDRYLSDGTFEFGDITPSEACMFTSNPQVKEGEVECELGNLAPNERVTIKVEVTADEPQNVNDFATAYSSSHDPNLDNNEDEDSVTFVNFAADLALQKDCTPNSLPAGESSICKMIVTNLGPNTADNVELVDVMSASAPFDYSVDDGAGSCDSGAGFGVTGKTITCDLASLASGAQWTVEVTLDSDTPNVIDDNATVTSDATDTDSANNQASDSVVFTGKADLSVVKEASPSPDVVAGTNVTYTLTVANAGPSPAVNVVVTDTLPAGMTPISVDSSTGSCTNGVVASCNLNTIASGGSETMTVVAKVNADVPEGAILSNNAAVASDSDDLDTSNNVDTASLNVLAIADLSITKADSPDPAVAGGTLTYMLAVVNDGPSNAVGVIVDDMLPEEVTFQSFNMTGAAGSCFIEDAATNLLRCLLGDMAPGASVSISVDVLVDPSVLDGAVIDNSATVSSSTTDDDPANNTADESTDIIAVADLWIDKTGNFETGNPSTTIIYFLTVYNRSGESEDDPQVSGDGGPSDAQNVVVTDNLPTTGKKNEPVSIVFLSEDCSAIDLVVTCQTDTIKVGEAAQHEIHIQVSGKVESLLNEASFTSDTTDPDATNNSDELRMVVKGGSDRPGGPGGGRGRGNGGKNK